MPIRFNASYVIRKGKDFGMVKSNSVNKDAILNMYSVVNK